MNPPKATKHPDYLAIEELNGFLGEYRCHIVWMVWEEYAQEWNYDTGANVGDDPYDRKDEIDPGFIAVHEAVKPLADETTWRDGFIFHTKTKATKALSAAKAALKKSNQT